MKENEVAQIEHELELLRSSYATMAYWARILRVFVWVMTTIPFAALAAYLLYTDLLGGLLLLAFSLVVGTLLWIIYRDMPFRWIDLASPRGLGWYRSLPRGEPVSEAQVIEHLIAERERRLAELKRASS